MVVASELFKLINEELRKENATDCIVKMEKRDNDETRIVLIFLNGLYKEFNEKWEQVV